LDGLRKAEPKKYGKKFKWEDVELNDSSEDDLESQKINEKEELDMYNQKYVAYADGR
jgi:hypothetical protein